ncbi:hypothetical protein AY601_0868 [Pedobacter cryoconitis]|uniref:Uncharacterized protein n=1 Tax=Pedobacter cryoconitis TaxID=188932 RepID=A0A127V996_9SPHI|nr:hypothetical protein [Pedobacter cryoconitis]AMP97809.1 hypothetical protein AY601_0868 [Pedobacter cryoconitis]
MARFWYAYNGFGDPLLPSSYNLASIRPACTNGANICAIYSPGSGNPSLPLSNNLRTYIANVQLTLLGAPDSSLGVKKYVYGKNL